MLKVTRLIAGRAVCSPRFHDFWKASTLLFYVDCVTYLIPSSAVLVSRSSRFIEIVVAVLMDDKLPGNLLA
jgi:hypothetical protein